ncbi:NAD-dependent epimerase/dehydratase family protein [Prochlorococcus sp. MIT 0916]|uniref:NAD-dependent epimerase/dehydratase family protein n=1 Tax=Prochlorococcus sp. MIT 0916 TaxID=3082521 RepID=UPI0039B4A995
MVDKIAFVLGSNGYVGKSLVKELISQNFFVIGIGRSPRINFWEGQILKNENFYYVSIQDGYINKLYEISKNFNIHILNTSIFFNLAWSGGLSLTGGGLEKQFENIILSCDSIKLAKRLGCKRYINLGSVQESYLDNYIKEKWKSTNKKFPSLEDYSLAKATCRDYNKLICYYEKIDYIHCNFSVFINQELNGKGYIHESLKAISKGESYKKPNSSQYYDLTLINEGCKAISLIATQGINNQDYYIGASMPYKLDEIFSIFENYKNNIEENIISNPPQDIINFFKNDLLYEKTKYKPQLNFNQFSKLFFKQ